MPGNENTKSGILQGLFICRTSELNPRYNGKKRKKKEYKFTKIKTCRKKGKNSEYNEYYNINNIINIRYL